MAQHERDGRPKRLGVGSYLSPVLLIFGLLAAYAVLADWRALPDLISSTLTFIG